MSYLYWLSTRCWTCNNAHDESSSAQYEDGLVCLYSRFEFGSQHDVGLVVHDVVLIRCNTSTEIK